MSYKPFIDNCTSWDLLDTGGHCYVGVKEYTLKSGDTKVIGINTECICIYDSRYDEDWEFFSEPVLYIGWLYADGSFDKTMEELKEYLEEGALAEVRYAILQFQAD